ncbi:MAG: sulfatase-like hydrolase/transferase, partial [Pseudomonadales bacterium]|nr:sulfatase-like hydrolase/transferase [Pseudomonadales bacterium]
MRNILFLMTDQQRWDAMGYLDRIAAEGVRFSDCVATSPLCVPMRVTLATGTYPHNNGVWGHIPHTVPAHADHWIREIRNLGYRTSLFGKTHLHPHGDSDLRDKEDLLYALGLDDVDEIGGPRASTSGMSHMTARWKDKGLLDAYRDDFKERSASKSWVVRPSALPLEDYYDVYVGQQAKRYLSSYDRDEPWFCWVSWGGPHQPWDTPEPYASRYDPESMPPPAANEPDPPRPSGQIDRMFENRKRLPAFEAGEVGAMRADYAGSVSLIDDQIGEILAVIEERGEMDSTVIAFTSDHGEMNGDHGLTSKSNFYDGAVRVPLIVRTPGAEYSGIVNDSPAETVDLGPTLVELAGGELEYRQVGKSLAGALDGSRHRDDALSEIMGEFMLMNDEWKIGLNKEGETYMLFDR